MMIGRKTGKKDVEKFTAPKQPFFKTIRKHWMLIAMLLPAIIYALVFLYAPMAGIVLAFKNYQYSGGIFGSPWGGLKNFKGKTSKSDAFVFRKP